MACVWRGGIGPDDAQDTLRLFLAVLELTEPALQLPGLPDGVPEGALIGSVEKFYVFVANTNWLKFFLTDVHLLRLRIRIHDSAPFRS